MEIDGNWELMIKVFNKTFPVCTQTPDCTLASMYRLWFSTHHIKLYSSFHSDAVDRAVLLACDLSWDDGSQQELHRSQHHATALIHDSQRGFPNAFFLLLHRCAEY